jgi:hypothetical protein
MAKAFKSTTYPWPKTTLEVETGDTIRLSVPFTWNLREARQLARLRAAQGYTVLAGGPAVNLMPEYLADVAKVGGEWPNAVQRHNPLATFTSRGCVYSCPYCSVPVTEGAFRELDDWPLAPVICDNNFLASSRAHFDRVIDRLKPIRKQGIDFNQGLDPRLMTPYHAHRLAELGCMARISFNHLSIEPKFLQAYECLRDAGFPKSRIRCYVLIGYDDTPRDALYRLRTVHDLGIKPYPCRYQPRDALAKDSYVHPNWTDRELRRFLHYWCRLNYHAHIPFEDFDPHYRRKKGTLNFSKRTVLDPPPPKGDPH